MRTHSSSARESAGEKCPGQDANLDLREEEEIELLTTGERAESVYNNKAAEAKIKYWRGAVYCLALLLFIQTCFTFWVLKSLPNWTACEIGFATDLDDAKPWISLEQTRFTNSLRADENGMLYKFSNPDDQTYTGAPSEEIEKAWDKLISGRYVRLMESEIVKLNGSAYDHPLEPVVARKHMITSSGVYGGIDVMHSLHCVNVLRKHLNSVDDLDVHLSAHYKQLHLDHCIDQLRQSIMCSGDLTPVTLRPVWEGKNHTHLLLLGQTEQKHTCRNFTALREWADQRGQMYGHILWP
ncbi:hypothetical protein N7471_011392 [Penicillium samsonianum]|uniref:uncharacterized protein n=1 Tax=Penicillium samsonianum TaxID=1882272 RepID=UPI002547F697|nr:uncharacterized protein N7471_011392 [Penicillium samsonianum]KAJ6124075.1 hypothetical protein N7471_011392 [Penicillium samsonianum]